MKEAGKSHVYSGVPICGISQESSNKSAEGPIKSPILRSGHVYREVPSTKLPKGK